MKKKDANRVIADELNLKFDFCLKFIIGKYFLRTMEKQPENGEAQLQELKLRKKHRRNSPEKVTLESQIERCLVDEIKFCQSSDVIRKQRLNSISFPESRSIERKKSFHSQIIPCEESFMKSSTPLAAKTRWCANGIFSFLFLLKQ